MLYLTGNEGQQTTDFCKKRSGLAYHLIILLIFGGCCNRYIWDIRLKMYRLPFSNFNMLFQLALFSCLPNVDYIRDQLIQKAYFWNVQCKWFPYMIKFLRDSVQENCRHIRIMNGLAEIVTTSKHWIPCSFYLSLSNLSGTVTKWIRKEWIEFYRRLGDSPGVATTNQKL